MVEADVEAALDTGTVVDDVLLDVAVVVTVLSPGSWVSDGDSDELL